MSDEKRNDRIHSAVSGQRARVKGERDQSVPSMVASDMVSTESVLQTQSLNLFLS